MSPRSATTWVPGHITGFFAVERAPDPLATGSIGAGLALRNGVTVTVTAPGDGTITVDGRERVVEPAERVLGTFDTGVSVAVDTAIPIGTGFGVSGAIALGAAVGANAVTGATRTENELIGTAHRAEVEAGTGMGDVVAQARGGVPIRLTPGGPEHGRLDGIPARRRVEYVSYDELSTAEVLAGDIAPINAAGRAALRTVRADPTLDCFMTASRKFAKDADLLTGRVAETIETVEDQGGAASMAMLGQTVFAFDRDLSDAGFDPAVTRIADGSLRID